MPTELETKISNGELWEEFCDGLKEAGQILLRPETPKDAFTQAEGMRYLTRLLRAGLEWNLEFADAKYPVFYRPSHETLKIGGDNPDNYYEKATVSGAYEYRISGTRGTVHYLGFGTQSSSYGKDGKMHPTGYIDATQMEINPDGTFELILSCEEKSGNWLPMKPETETIIVRQTFNDREGETPAHLKIERIGAQNAPPPLAPETLGEGLLGAIAFVKGTATLFANWSQGYAADPVNELTLFSHDTALSVGGDPNIRYYYGLYDFAEDEALVIESKIPDCEYWNFQMNNYWMESHDYRYHRIHFNEHYATREADGSIRIVVAHKDPGVTNWADTAGHERGILMWRWVGSDEHPTPTVRKVKVSQL